MTSARLSVSKAMTTRRVRALHILGTLDHGGAELRAIEQMHTLAAEGVVADFLCLSGRPGALADRPSQWGGRVIPMRLSWLFPVTFLRFLRRERYDVVHSHVATASGFTLALACAAGVPRRVAQFHSDGDGRAAAFARRTQRLVMRLLLRRTATALVGVSPQSLRFGAGSSAERDARAAILTNGVSPSALPLPSERTGRFRLVNVGRPLDTKRREFLMPILRAVLAAGLDAELVVVGKEGDDTDALRQEAAKNGIADRVHLLGVRDDVRAVLNDTDVLVFPSSREGLPVVLLESLFEGTPVVASDLPGMVFIKESLPGVPLTTVPVAAGADEWARAVADMLVSAPSRAATRELMGGSAFTMERALGVLRSAYGMDGHAGC